MPAIIRPEVFIAAYDCRTALPTLPDGCIDCVVTSPPYFGIRDYGSACQIGLEQTPEEYVSQLVDVFREVRRVLKDDGTVWLNLGDSYVTNPSTSSIPRSLQGNGTGAFRIPSDADMMARRMMGRANAATPLIRSGLKKKDIIGIPWRLAFALQADGWWLRQDIIWHKTNAMPESVRDRCVRAHEYVFLLSKSERYSYDWDAVAEPCVSNKGGNVSRKTKDAQNGAPNRRGGPAKPRTTGENVGVRGLRDVWSMPTANFHGPHSAVMPLKLAETCVLAGCRPGGAVLDPFGGSGTTGLAAALHGRNAYLAEANPDHAALACNRLVQELALLAEVTLDTPELAAVA